MRGDCYATEGERKRKAATGSDDGGRLEDSECEEELKDFRDFS